MTVSATLPPSLKMSIDEAGFALLENVFTPSEVEHWKDVIAAALQSQPPGSHVHNDQTYAARNLLGSCEELATLWRTPMLEQVVQTVLGDAAGLVRATYFDKTSGSSWAVPWHKDLVVSVDPPADSSKSGVWGPVKQKHGVAHSEAPLSVLRKMLQIRVNLDEQTDVNGALAVLPKSHRDGKTVQMSGYRPHPVFGRAGSALVLRPLVAHASGHTRDEVGHRRVLALEFAATQDLPDGFRWHDWVGV